MADTHKLCFESIEHAVIRLSSRPATPNDVDLFLKDVRAVALHDEAHAAVTARIFSELARAADDEFKRRVYLRAVHECCVKFNREAARRIVLVPGPRDAKEALLHLAEGTTGKGDLVVLRRCYGRLFGDDEIVDGHAALAQWIAGGELMNRLVERCFSTFDDSVEIRECLCIVLACAGSFMARPQACSKLKDRSVRNALKGEVETRKRLLLSASKVCVELKPDSPRFFYRDRIGIILDGIKADSIVALGVLFWARTMFLKSQNEQTLIFTAPKFLGFIDAVAEFHRGLRRRAVDTVDVCFKRKIEAPEIAGEIRDKCVEAFAGLVERCAGDLVVQKCMTYADDRTLDDAHIRGLVKAILGRVKPPFGRRFAIRLKAFIIHRRVINVARRDEYTSSLVDEFLREMRNCCI